MVGKSGTGKSFRAKLVAEKYNIPYIIDDGLLIEDNKIIAGKSAKKEAQYIGAIRTAVFDNKTHRYDVIQAIKKSKIKRILILGTSEKMVNKVAKRLNLPSISKVIKIEEISSEEDIKKAIESRKSHGMHVIPVPTIEVKKDYAQILSDSIKIMFKKGLGLAKNNTRIFEKSVVRPEFQKNKGEIVISEAALGQMVLHCFDEFDCSIQVKKLKIKNNKGNYKIRVSIEAPYGTQLGGKLHNLQKYTIEHIERFTGIMIDELAINIDYISMEKRRPYEKT